MDLATDTARVELDQEACRRILETRDPRFGGHFFIGVHTTGVYCRPICPARPKPENCAFFACAAAAQEAGYRPCLRCRSEAGDLGLRRVLAGADGKLPSERTLRERAEAWRPWRA